MTNQQKNALYLAIKSMADAYLAILDPTTESNFVTDFVSIRENAESKLHDLWALNNPATN